MNLDPETSGHAICELAIQECLAMTKAEQGIILPLRPTTAFTLVSLLQLAWRHPHLPEGHYRKIKTLVEAIVSQFPDSAVNVRKLVAMGWDKSFDV